MNTHNALAAIKIAIDALDAECRRSPQAARHILAQLDSDMSPEARAIRPLIYRRAEAQHGKWQIDN